MARAASPSILEHLTDEQLEAHIETLEYWLQFDQDEVCAAVAERDRRGRGGYELTEAAELYLSAHLHRVAA